MEVHSLLFSRKILLGSGAADRVGREAKELGGKKGLIVTDKTLTKLGLVDKIKKSLEKERIEFEVLAEVKPEPSLEIAKLTAQVAREGKYEIVVGLGGGSVLDIAKVASIAVTNPDDVKAFIGYNVIKKPGVPKILIPTTAGTGSEVSPATVLHLTTEKRKAAIITPYNLADVAIVDPLLTVSMPPKLTASTGFDVLGHAIDAYTSKRANRISNTLAIEAIKLVANNLREVYTQGENLEARYNMALASLLAGIALAGAAMTAGHAAASVISVKYKIQHGISVALALPYIMRYNMIACLSKLACIAEALGERTSVLTTREAALKAAIAVKSIMEDVDFPTRLKDVGVPESDIPDLAESLVKRPASLSFNPRNIDDAIELFRNMWEGKIDD